MRRLTQSEAVEMVETVWETSPDLIAPGRVEAFVVERTAQDAEHDLAGYLSIIAAVIDPDSITITEDALESALIECCQIVIQTGEMA